MVFRGSVARRRDELLAVVADLDVDVVLRRTAQAARRHPGALGAAVRVAGPDLLLPRLLGEGLDEQALRELDAELLAAPLPEHEPLLLGRLATGAPVARGRLCLEGRSVGEVALVGSPDDELDEAALEWLEVLTGVAEVALRNARTFALSELRRDWWELTGSVTGSIHPPFSLSDPVNRIVEGAHRITGADVAAVVRGVDGDGYDVAAELSAYPRALPPLLEQVGGLVHASQRSGEPFEVRWGAHGTIAGFPLAPELAFEGVVLVAVAHGDGVLPAHVRELTASFVTHGSLVMDRAVLLSERQQELVAADRTRIARDLHDVVVQRLFSVGMRLRAAVRGERPTDSAQVQETVQEAVQEAVADLDTTIRDIRGTIFELERGRETSVRAEVAALAREYEPALGFRPTVRTFGAVDSLVGRPLAEQLTVVLREALANCARHAGATACVVEVRVDHEQVSLVVVDDGRGPARDESPDSGLRNLRQRAEALGGGLVLESASPRGTRLTWTVPTSAQ